ncbi:hypothetical protein FVEG_16492 [Fusarium verticillioides 7600]|uniref:Uncharacterized protein n=1 Tax=Gibberella moniliformis (strain M3125 / FGSC 7600) TaxID=334819 RepID=W7MNX0_GIBM7|nr:hypothetical protein FVEG_16492 [Fusarium verticillioides 7600]EWG49449.1 hypothetical protein FVEG_16492 [Fusarium verticillioides 7600]
MSAVRVVMDSMAVMSLTTLKLDIFRTIFDTCVEMSYDMAPTVRAATMMASLAVVRPELLEDVPIPYK